MTNSKSCLLDATIHTLCLKSFKDPAIPESVYTFYSRIWHKIATTTIGHDGSERGFHTQEIQDFLRGNGVVVQKHEVFPCLQLPPGPDDPSRVRVIPIYEKLDAANIFLPKINRNNGVLIVRSAGGVHHALSFQAGSNTAYNVSKKEYVPLEDLDVVMYLEFIYETGPFKQEANRDFANRQPDFQPTENQD